jgi:predicted phosphodiesterase
MRVAALADVHGNAPALEAVLREVEAEKPDAIVFCGDTTWGPLPRETLEVLEPWRDRATFVRGNSERELVEQKLDTPRAVWVRAQHEGLELPAYVGHAVVDVDGLGPTRFVHGSPRSDEECVTEETPVQRVDEFMHGVREQVVVTAHTHVSYDRRIGHVRLLNPGSVGLPYEGVTGVAFWALLGPEVELRRTAYDLEAALARLRASGMAEFELIEELMTSPPSRAETIERAETVVFAG